MEVIVVVGIVSFALVLVLMALPRGREASRMVHCQKNMSQIGFGLQLYHQAQRHLPTVPALDRTKGDGPVKTMLNALVLPDFLDIHDLSQPPRPTQAPPKGTRIPGLACPSDSNAMGGLFSPSISYRANTGDNPGGTGGPFEPGRVMANPEIEAADGASFTAGYAERLVGDGHDESPANWNYSTSPGTIAEASCLDSPTDRWRGDAGADWSEASWRSTLYNHALAPNGGPSCIANDGRSGVMGVSSGHVNRVNILMMDGSIRGVTRSIDPKIWQAMGTVGHVRTQPKP